MLNTSFQKFIIIDWYDKIINAFFKIEDEFYYCNLLFEARAKNEYIYVCMPLNFFVECTKIIKIIESDTLKENWEQLYDLLNHVQKENKSYLIKTQNLQFGSREVANYKDNFNWNIGILFFDYPEILDKASKVDNWEQYFAQFHVWASQF